jgi:HAD superfamily hydrolase (TIGR01509 family)
MFKHIIFDCDGVLIDTEIVAAEEMAAWLRKQGIDISAETYIRIHTGKTFSGIIREYIAKGELAQDIKVRHALEEIESRVVANIRPVEGVIEALPLIKQALSVVSNSGVAYVKNALKKYAVDQHFEGRIFSSEMVAAPKPSPLVYELAVQQIGLPKNEILVIEDSHTGVAAARAAGLTVWGFLGGSHILAGHGEKLLKAGVSDLIKDYSGLNEKLA